ncbi:MAG: hypothetical protein ACE5LX_05885 [Nitrospinota bacterium]
MKGKLLFGEKFSKEVKNLAAELEERGLISGKRLDRSGCLLTLRLVEERWRPLSQDAKLDLIKSVGNKFSALRRKEGFSLATVKFTTEEGVPLGVYDSEHGIALRIKEGKTPDSVKVIPH